MGLDRSYDIIKNSPLLPSYQDSFFIPVYNQYIVESVLVMNSHVRNVCHRTLSNQQPNNSCRRDYASCL